MVIVTSFNGCECDIQLSLGVESQRADAQISNQIKSNLKWTLHRYIEKRRIRGDLIQVFQIAKGFDKVDMGSFFELGNGGGHALRGHKWKLKINRRRLQLRKCFFRQRIVSIWNKLHTSKCCRGLILR